VTPATRRALLAAANGSGRSLSQEAELRLEQSFHDAALLPQLLNLAYRPPTPAALLVFGHIIDYVAYLAHVESLARRSQQSGRVAEVRADWLSDPATFAKVEAAIRLAFDRLRPPGESKPPGAGTEPEGLFGQTVTALVDAQLELIARPETAISDRDRVWIQPIHDQLDFRVIENLRTALPEQPEEQGS
jgi:hypothetical protein